MSTVWGQRAPGARMMQAEEEEGLLVLGDFYSSDAFRVPEDTPHALAGTRVRVSRRFRSIDPSGTYEGEGFAHVWCAGGLGVAELPGRFVVYETASWNDDLPRHDDEVVR